MELNFRTHTLEVSFTEFPLPTSINIKLADTGEAFPLSELNKSTLEGVCEAFRRGLFYLANQESE